MAVFFHAVDTYTMPDRDDTDDETERIVLTDHPVPTETAVPVFTIDVEALFGHIQPDTERAQRAEDYKDRIREAWRSRKADEALILPTEVEFELVTPEPDETDE